MFASGEISDAGAHLLQKAFYVEPLNYPMDFEKFPTNGHEYIHHVRQEEVFYFPETFKENTEDIPFCFPKETEIPKNRFLSLGQWKRDEADSFSYLACELHTKKEHLKKKFHKRTFPPANKEKDWCLFSLGSSLYKKIYEDEELQDLDGTYPYLSIVLYLSQDDIIILLKYMKNWLHVIGMDHALCRWIYSLLACVIKPLYDECETFLEDFYDDLIEKCKVYDKSQQNQFHLISSILKNYFCIKAFEIGPNLEQFVKMS